MTNSVITPVSVRRERATTIALTLLRVGVGLIMTTHGFAKLMDIPGTAESFAHIGLPAPQVLVYFAIAGELLGGLGLTLGLLARLAALGPVCTMLVAILSVHLSHGLLAKNGGFEYPLVLLLVGGFFALNGPGRLSLDALLAKRAARAHRARAWSRRRALVL